MRTNPLCSRTYFWLTKILSIKQWSSSIRSSLNHQFIDCWDFYSNIRNSIRIVNRSMLHFNISIYFNFQALLPVILILQYKKILRRKSKNYAYWQIKWWNYSDKICKYLGSSWKKQCFYSRRVDTHKSNISPLWFDAFAEKIISAYNCYTMQ